MLYLTHSPQKYPACGCTCLLMTSRHSLRRETGIWRPYRTFFANLLCLSTISETDPKLPFGGRLYWPWLVQLINASNSIADSQVERL